MIFDSRLKNNPPESVILDILAKKPKQSSKEVYGYFTKKYQGQMTIQGFYKVLKKLLARRILIKEGQFIYLDSFWINKFVDLARIMEDSYLHGNVSFTTILEEGESRTIEFENILAMDNTWEHALNMVRNYYADLPHHDKNVYSRNYFSVFHIARTEGEAATLKYFQASGMEWYMASGSDSFLNRLASKLIEEENYHQVIFDFEAYNQKTKSKIDKNYWVTVIGDFIFEAHFPKYIFEMLENIYTETKYIGDFNPVRINKLFQEPGKAVLTISRDRKRAEIIREDVKKLYRTYNK